MLQFSTNDTFSLANKISQIYRHRKIHVHVLFDRTKEKVKITNSIIMCAAKLNFAKLPNENNDDVFTQFSHFFNLSTLLCPFTHNLKVVFLFLIHFKNYKFQVNL
jgi:hypothetical protein